MSVRRTILTGAAVAGVIALAATGGAIAADQIGSAGIKDDSLQSVDYKDGSVKEHDTSDWIQQQLQKAGTPGQDGADGEDGQVVAEFSQSDPPTTVENVGGSWGTLAAPRATLLDTVTLQPGKYILTADGFFITNSADASRDVRMQLALRVDDGTTWGQDFGTAFTGEMSPLADREATTSTTRVVEVEAETDVLVFAFGYEDDQGSAASGQVDATSYVTASEVR